MSDREQPNPMACHHCGQNHPEPKSERTASGPSDAMDCSALPVPRDRGGKGWKTKVSLCEAIVKAVTYKSGTYLYAETVDDVIQELEKRGHLKYEPNGQDQP